MSGAITCGHYIALTIIILCSITEQNESKRDEQKKMHGTDGQDVYKYSVMTNRFQLECNGLTGSNISDTSVGWIWFMVLNDMPWLWDLQQTSTRFHMNESFVQMYSIPYNTCTLARAPHTWPKCMLRFHRSEMLWIENGLACARTRKCACVCVRAFVYLCER